MSEVLKYFIIFLLCLSISIGIYYFVRNKKNSSNSQPQVASYIKTDIKKCPNDCFKKGDCNLDGKCDCFTGYSGEDCSISDKVIIREYPIDYGGYGGYGYNYGYPYSGYNIYNDGWRGHGWRGHGWSGHGWRGHGGYGGRGGGGGHGGYGGRGGRR
jgi:hypothetical protein